MLSCDLPAFSLFCEKNYLSRIDRFENSPWILLVAMVDQHFEILEDLSVLQVWEQICFYKMYILINLCTELVPTTYLLQAFWMILAAICCNTS